MKICIWCTKIFDLGGTKRVVTLLANELVKEHDVTIMVYQDRFKEDRNMYHMSEDIKVDFIDNNEFVNRHHTPAFFLRYLVRKLNAKYGIFNKEKYNNILADAIFPKKTREKWVEYLNEQDYDIIITTASLSLRLGMLAPDLKAKTIGWQHNCYAGYLDVPNVVFWKQECLLQEYLPKLDRYIVLSEYDQRDYKKFLDIDTEVKINPRSFVSERKCDPKSRHFLMATRFVYAKGLDLMMESFEEFCKQDDEWQLDIIGAGDLWNQIVADAKRRGIEDRVNFVGYTNEPEKYYLSSSIFLLPSRWEGWPMVIMEAFEFGLPVIAFHTGAMDLIIDDGKTGYLPEAFDTKKFTEAMLKLAHDEELRREMSRNAIWKSEDFAIEKAVKEWNNLFNRVMGIETFYMKNEEQIRECREKYPLRTCYAEFVKEYQLRDKTILYEAFGGRGMICNPFALFQYLLEKEEYQDYTHIWVLEDFDDNRAQIEKYEKYPNVRFVQYKTKEYCKAIATVKYLVNNVSFPSYFLKREGQVLIDTWHGTPLKNMGFDIPGANISQGNTARNLFSADYIISSGPYMTETAYKRSYKMQNLYEGTVLEEGFPRNDKLFNSDRAEVIRRLQECGVEAEENKKIILYAPTWRGEQYRTPDTDLQDVYKLLRIMEDSIDTEKYQVLVKLHQIVYHYMKEKQIEPGTARTKFVPATMDTSELLSVTDVLVSDYSSIFYDFMLTGRPILFYVPDMDSFENYRGLYFGFDNLPGPAVSVPEKLGALLKDLPGVADSYKEKYEKVRSQIGLKDDGKVCEHIAEVVFDGKEPTDPVHLDQTDKVKLLVYAGDFNDTQETAVFYEFLDKVDFDHFDITLIGNGAKEEESAKRLDELPKEVRVLYWKRSYPATDEEYVRHSKFMKSKKTEPSRELRDFYKRELRRILGMSRFDYAVIFTDMKKFFPAMSGALDVKQIFNMENWPEVLNK